MTIVKANLEEVYSFLKGIRFMVMGYNAHLVDVWIKDGDWLSFFIHNIKNIKEGMEYTLIAESVFDSGGYTAEGTEVYMASTPLKSGNLLIEVKILDPVDDGWIYHNIAEFAFLC